jgi:Reverse transcriptase (RNA-dependent DNA polymerase)/Integrase core domain/GAG-pre-integrase domain
MTAATTTGKASAQVWHERAGHIGKENLRKMADMVLGMEMDGGLGFCGACILGKHHRDAFPKQNESSEREVLELVHSDVCGPMSVTTPGGSRYFGTLIDDKSRMIFVACMKSKDEIFEHFKDFKAFAENTTGKRIKAFRSDGGGEYISKRFSDYLKSHGIQHQKSSPYSPQQNGVAERANRTLLDMARSMIHANNLPTRLWGEAILTAAHIKNRAPTSVLEVTPFEIWSNKKPDISYFRIFGSKAYAPMPEQGRRKLDPRAKELIFVGYQLGSKAYRLYNPTNGKVSICRDRDVIIKEEVKASGSNDTTIITTGDPFPTSLAQSPQSQSKSQPQSPQSESQLQPQSEPEVSPPSRPENSASHTTSQPPSPRGNPSDDYDDDMLDSIEVIPPAQNIAPKRSTKPVISTAASTRPRRYPALIATLPSQEPLNFQQALASNDWKKWEKAIESELKSIRDNDTWELVRLPVGRKAIGSKWVFKIKADGRFKARLCARGYTQQYGIDYEETFAPVAKFTTIRTLLAIAAKMDLEIHHMDVKTAFLNGIIDEEIYMEQPEGYEEDLPETGNNHNDDRPVVCRLKKSIYGLKQSPRAWYSVLDTFLTSNNLNFKRAHSDHSLYINHELILFIIIYVDDILIFGKDPTLIANIKDKFHNAFSMTDLGPATRFLGLEIARDRQNLTITLHQNEYIKDILKRFNMSECKPVSTPMDPGTKLTKADPTEVLTPEDKTAYQSIVGSLMYTMLGTRPDIAYAVGSVSQFNSAPGVQHMTAVKRILRYLKGTAHYGLVYSPCTEDHDYLEGYSDANWGSSEDRRSTGGFVFFLGSAAISWSSKKQPTVALSSTEAEYMAITQATKESIWLQRLINEISYPIDKITLLHADNQGCIALAKNPQFHARSKHIDIQHHFIREKVESEEIDLVFCRTEDMIADIMTKALGGQKHWRFTSLMGISEIDLD